MPLRRDKFFRSLDAQFGKIWICERLIQTDGHNPRETFATLSADRYLPKLIIPRWAAAVNPYTHSVGEGLRAPYPDEEQSWLDLKGAFVTQSDTVYQAKSPAIRAVDLHNCGWT